MRTVLSLLAVLALGLAAPSFAEAPKVTTSLAGVPGGKYLLDKSHANIIFSINHLGYSYYKGRFNDFDATLFFEGDPAKSAVKATINIASVDTNNGDLEIKLKSPVFFDAAKYAEASFTSTKFEKTSDTTGKLTGDFSMHGFTRPLTLDVTFNGTGLNPYSHKQTLGFAATGKLNRSDFGMKEYLPAVGDEVTFTIDAEFAQAD